MIALKVNGRHFKLPPQAKVTFKLINPIFDENGLIKGSSTLPFDISGLDELNQVLLGNPDIIENATSFRKQMADILFDDIFFKRGKMVTKNAGSSISTCHFIFGLTTLRDEIKTKKVRDIIAETIVIDNTAITKKIYLVPGFLAADPYIINVNGRTYSAASLTLLRDAINADTTVPRASCTYVAVGSTPQGLDAPYLEITPYVNPNDPLTPLHVSLAEDNGNASTGFKWYAEAFNMDGYHQGFFDALEGYFTGDYPTNKVRFPFMINSDMYGESSAYESSAFFQGTKEQPYVNGVWNFETFITNQANWGLNTNRPFVVKNRNSLQPYLRMKYVLEKIAEYFGFNYEGDWVDDVDTEAMLIDNAAPLDDPQDFIGSKKFVFWKRSFRLEDLIPDITVVDLFKYLRDRYNLAIYKNELSGNVRIQKREPIIKALQYEDMTSVSSPFADIDNQLMTGIRLKAEKSDIDKSAVDDIFETGDPEDEIPSKISGLPAETNLTDIMGVECDVDAPVIKQPKGDKFPFRVFYYKGIATSDGPIYDFDYPKASINALNYTETFAGASGIYETKYKRWVQAILNRRACIQTWSIPYRRIIDLDWELKRRFDRNDFLIKSLEFSLDSVPRERIKVKVELYTTS